MPPKPTYAKVHKLKKLLNMPYKISEIADELGVSYNTVYRSYLPAGVPCHKDGKGNIWINGTEFYAWAEAYLTTRQRKPKHPLENGQAYCLHCNQVITIIDRKTRPPNVRGVVNVSGRCPLCGGKVNRFEKGGTHDQSG